MRPTPNPQPEAHPPSLTAPQQVGDAVCRAAWDSLTNATLPRALAIIGWRALHCQLLTPSLQGYRLYAAGFDQRLRSLGSPLANASCRHPSCPRVVATATHVLLECAQSLPAARWLCDLWAAIDGGGARPPLHPDVIIAGRTDTWPLHRTKTRLWTLLRLLLLTQIWQAHQRLHSSGTPTSPSGIVAAVIRAGTQLLRTDFLTTHTSPAVLARTCAAFMTGATCDSDPPQDFQTTWVLPGLCNVSNGNLTVLWSSSFPVALPR